MTVAASSGQRTGRRRSPGTAVGVAAMGIAAGIAPTAGGFVVAITRLA
jgi:hypothetical protein